MSRADPAFSPLPPAGSAEARRPVDLAGRARTTRRWAVGVLVAATLVMFAYLVAVVAITWLFASAWTGLTAREALSFDLLAVVVDIAPVLLVGWGTGLATSALLARGEALGPRAAGVTAGLVGTVAGATMLALADSL